MELNKFTLKEKTLLVMAAGLGSRFGGLKQIEPMGPNNEFIIDYSIYDAILAGFTKVVFIIKEENYASFKDTIGKRIESKIKVEYVFQDNKNIPIKYQESLKDRIKPLGTAHAIYCAKNKIIEPFAVINADDFYGRDAILKAASYLDNILKDHYGLIGYKVKNTLGPKGTFKRGVCKVNNNKLESITESSIERKNNIIIATSEKTNEQISITSDTTVCMNLLLFSPDIFEILESEFQVFLENNKEDLKTCEFLIPDILDKCIKENLKTIDVIKTAATWYGVTYKEDKLIVVKALKDLTTNNIYPQLLWKS